MDFKSDENGDLVIENGDFVFVTGIDATAQFLGQGLRLFLGEWFLDETIGVPYFDEVFVKNPNPVALDTIFKTYILNFPGIEELLAFDFGYEAATRKFSITGRIRGLDGEADFSVVNLIPGA